MHRIVVANAKGGCGKTTITTNLSSFYSSKGLKVRLFDYDEQESSIDWLNSRNAHPILSQKTTIEGVAAHKNYDHQCTRSWMLRVTHDIDRVVVDTPAGTSVSELCSILNQDDKLIIPVMASPIDIKAATRFIHTLKQQKLIKEKNIQIAVVANRVRQNTLIYYSLEQFLLSLNVPFLTSLRDTQLYSKAYETGCGVGDLKINRAVKDKYQWAPIIRWCESKIQKYNQDTKQMTNAQVHNIKR
ncbi:MAG: AAA family ATPase [Gammaproteobacteria bacterium]|nr:AAA family ATPase [Gammaproteobacteria bacterium]